MEEKEEDKKINKMDDLTNNLETEGYDDEDMDEGIINIDKQLNQEQQLNIPIYDNIDKEFEQFGKMIGAEDEFNISSKQKNPKELIDENKIMNNILIEEYTEPKNNKNDMEELSKQIKTVETNLNKKHRKDRDDDLLKEFLDDNLNKKKKDDGIDDLGLENINNNIKININKNKYFQKNENEEEDLYPLQQEKIFHRINQMKSLTVLEKEIELCHFIIKYKKRIQAAYEEWEKKKELAIQKLNNIKTNIINGNMNYKSYKKDIEDELNYEQILLNVYLTKDQVSSFGQKEEIKKRINNRIIIINKEINDEIKDEEDEEEEKEKLDTKKENISEINLNLENMGQIESNEEKIKIYIELLLQQYLAAKNYFNENNFKVQEKDCIEKCNQLIIAKTKIQEGNIKEININELPQSIKPEYIYGYNSEDRASKFKEILSQLIKQKDTIEQKKKYFTEKIQKLKKRDFKKIKDSAKDVLNSYQEKINKYHVFIESIKEKFNDKWVPAPLYYYTEEENKVENINKDIPKNVMRIHIGKTNYDKDNIYLKIKLVYDKKELVKEVHLKECQDFNETWDWIFKENEYKNLSTKSLDFEMERKYWYKFGGSNIKGKMKIDLNYLKDNIQLIGDYKIELVSKRTSPSINVSINLRTPFGGKKYETFTNEVFSIKKIYPPFNPKSTNILKASNTNCPNKEIIYKDANININTNNESKQEIIQKPKLDEKNEIETNLKLSPENANDNIISENNITNNPQDNDNTLNQQIKVDKSMFENDELADVDGLDYINSFKVLDYKLKLLEIEISKISDNIPNDLLQKKVLITHKINILKQYITNGNISPQDYYNLIIRQITHDQALFSYLKQENEIEKANLVAIRIQLMNEEIEELK